MVFANTTLPLPVSHAPTFCLILLSLSLLLTGCPREQPKPAPVETPRASVALRVLVVNAPPLAEAINRLRGEWAERSGGELTAESRSWQEVAEAKQLDVDAIVFPSRYLGEFCTRGWLRPVRGSLLDDEKLQFADFFPLVRNELLKWGGETMALPLGLDATAFPPLTAPSARRPSVVLLLKAGPTAITNEKLGFLFDTDGMKPRITEMPFVEALARWAPPSPVGAAGNGDSPNPTEKSETLLPLLGNEDRLIAVSASSHNAASAFRLIAWLAQPETSSQLARAAEPVLPARTSLASSAQWYEPSIDAEQRTLLARRLTTELNGQRCILLPRIPGIDEYLAALDEAVNAAVKGKVPPAEALQRAAEQWEAITNAHSRAAQHSAYLKHLNIAD